MERCEEWKEDNWKTLLYAIHHQNCILLLGPDASIEQVHDQTQSVTEILAKGLSQTFEVQEIQDWSIDPSNLAQVSLYYCLKKGRYGLEAMVDDFYQFMQSQTSDLYEDLAALPFYFAITSTPDYMFYEALERAGKTPRIASYNFGGDSPDFVDMGTKESPLLYYLYGMLEEAESLVLTETDIIDFLAAIISGDPPLPDNISNELHDKKKSLLFLGFGFKHWYLRILLHVLKEPNKKIHSFALEQFTPRNQAEFARTLLFFKESDDNLHIFHNDDLQNFVRELRERYEKKFLDGKTRRRKSSALLQDAPFVFLCFAKENEEDAIFMCDYLRQQGINARFDIKDIQAREERIYKLGELQLPSRLHKKIVGFLSSLPSVHDNDERKAFLYSAGLDAQLQNQLNFALPPIQFFQLLVPILSKYGTLADGRNALKAVLQSAKSFVGQQKQEYCDILIQEFDAVLTETEDLVSQHEDTPDGDGWDYRIRQVIEQKANYFVILQSRMLVERFESYFHKEVELALKRQQEFRSDTRFIIPVKIEECHLLQAVDNFQTIDIRNRKNIDELVRVITLDYQQRNER